MIVIQIRLLKDVGMRNDSISAWHERTSYMALKNEEITVIRPSFVTLNLYLSHHVT